MFDFNPAGKPNHKRLKTKRADRTKFSASTRISIIERDKCCVRCMGKGEHVHHIRFRSELTDDVSHKRNGCLVCNQCHSWAHSGSDGREWFVRWKADNLDENGDYKLPFSDIENEDLY